MNDQVDSGRQSWRSSTFPAEQRTIKDAEEVRAFLGAQGIDYERTEPSVPVPPDAPADVLLAAYKNKIDELKARGGYVTADVIDVFPHTPNLDAMLNKFNSEHWHDEDEVRFIVEGHGLFHIHPKTGPVFAIEVGAGDLIRVPKRHAPLVRPLRRSADPRDPAVPGSLRLDAALHAERRRQGISAGLLRAGILPVTGSRRSM